MATNVPRAILTPVGFTAPSEADILAGVQADQRAAFGGDLAPELTTPQGQLAMSETAIIGDANDQFLALANGVDPALADGRMQDAIARIYFLDRIASQSTVVVATCSGLTGTVIPVGAQAKDQAGRLWLATEAGTIPIGGSVDLTFACAETGPIAAPIGYVDAIYQAIPGWDSVTNAGAGVLGRDVETRADFEYRRQRSVAVNANGNLESVLGAVLQVPGVLDAYAAENTSGTVSGAAVTAAIAGTLLTVSAAAGAAIAAGMMVVGTGVATGTIVTSFGSGSGGTGTYNVSISQTVGSVAMVVAPGGVSLLPHSIFVAAYGGQAQAVGDAIWSKKMPGCDYNGNTTVTVVDDVNYSPPYPSYAVTFEIPAVVAIKFAVSIQNNASVPSDAEVKIKAAIVAAFNGADGGARARIGSAIFASRFYAGIAALGPWALIYSILLGVGTADRTSVLMPINKIPTLVAGDISVTLV